VVDDVVGADRSDQVDLGGAADPVTSAPNALASCTANDPTRPPPPMTRTCIKGLTIRPLARPGSGDPGVLYHYARGK
jgi:hypothetical protein